MEQIRSMNEILDEVRTDIRAKKIRRIKRTTLMSLVSILIVLIMVGTTMSMLNTKTETITNKFAFGQAKINIIENTYNWSSKQVKLQVPLPAAGETIVPGVARVMFVPYIMNGTESEYVQSDLGAMTAPVGNKVTMGDIVLELSSTWSNDWFYKDGFFYYKKVLYPEAGKNETPVLLTKVSFAGNAADMKTKYNGKQVNVEVMADILQAEGSAPDTGKVLITEWGVHVNNGTVTP